jgi:hypothetical protein
MIRQTSIEAYNLIRDNGLLSKRRWEVYDILFHHGPMTANETFAKLYRNNLGPFNAASNSAARFSELRNCGVVYEVRERQCTITGMKAIEWDVTDRLPVKFEKPTRVKCKYCNGTGLIKESQGRLL